MNQYKSCMIFCFGLFLWVLLMSGVNADDRVPLIGVWKFQYGDNADWARPDFDDTSWKAIKVPGLIKQVHNQPINGWYRLKFDAHVDINEPHALLIDSIRHSDETWINGIRVGGKGIFEAPWHFTQTNPIELVRLYKIPAGFLKEKNNTLAIRTNIGFGQAQGAMFPGGAGIVRGNVYLGDTKKLSKYEQQQLIKTSSIDVIFITLGLVEIFIILFLLRNSIHIFPEFKWLLFTSLIMLLGTIGHDFFYIHGLQGISVNLLLVIALLCMPLSVALYFWAQYRNVPLKIVQITVTIWAILSLLILLPSVTAQLKVSIWYGWMFLATLFFSYALYCALLGVYLKRVGAYMQLLGMIIFLISIRTQWLPDTFFGHRNVQIGSLVYRYALLFAYFQKIKQMQVDYKNITQRVVKITDNVYANLARELHDGIGQHLASMKLQTKLAGMQTRNLHLDNLNTELDASVTGLRRLLSGLHPVLIDQNDIATALKIESENKEKIHNIHIKLDIRVSTLDKSLEHQIFRIFQECITNAIQHGKADEIGIELKQSENKVTFLFFDNGKGFDRKKLTDHSNQTGLGLVSLNERISLLNGQLSIRSSQKFGTEIFITIPIPL